MSSLHNYQILIGNWEIWKLGNLFKEEDKIIVAFVRNLDQKRAHALNKYWDI